MSSPRVCLALAVALAALSLASGSYGPLSFPSSVSYKLTPRLRVHFDAVSQLARVDFIASGRWPQNVPYFRDLFLLRSLAWQSNYDLSFFVDCHNFEASVFVRTRDSSVCYAADAETMAHVATVVCPLPANSTTELLSLPFTYSVDYIEYRGIVPFNVSGIPFVRKWYLDGERESYYYDTVDGVPVASEWDDEYYSTYSAYRAAYYYEEWQTPSESFGPERQLSDCRYVRPDAKLAPLHARDERPRSGSRLLAAMELLAVMVPFEPEKDEAEVVQKDKAEVEEERTSSHEERVPNPLPDPTFPSSFEMELAPSMLLKYDAGAGKVRVDIGAQYNRAMNYDLRYHTDSSLFLDCSARVVTLQVTSGDLSSCYTVPQHYIRKHIDLVCPLPEQPLNVTLEFMFDVGESIEWEYRGAHAYGQFGVSHVNEWIGRGYYNDVVYYDAAVADRTPVAVQRRSYEDVLPTYYFTEWTTPAGDIQPVSDPSTCEYIFPSDKYAPFSISADATSAPDAAPTSGHGGPLGSLMSAAMYALANVRYVPSRRAEAAKAAAVPVWPASMSFTLSPAANVWYNTAGLGAARIDYMPSGGYMRWHWRFYSGFVDCNHRQMTYVRGEESMAGCYQVPHGEGLDLLPRACPMRAHNAFFDVMSFLLSSDINNATLLEKTTYKGAAVNVWAIGDFYDVYYCTEYGECRYAYVEDAATLEPVALFHHAYPPVNTAYFGQVVTPSGPITVAPHTYDCKPISPRFGVAPA